jgi:hypothetical protein
MAGQPTSEFGKRRPAPIETAPPVKRSRHVALLLMGSFALGGSAYTLTPSENCEPNRPGMAGPPRPQGGAECQPRGSSSGGGHGGSGGSWSRRNFFSGDSAPGGASSGTASEAGSGNVTRGGFGSFARAFAMHFSGAG